MATIAERKAQHQRLWSETPWDDVAAYIGPNAEKFRAVWEKQRAVIAKKGSGIAWGFCWPVFFFSFVWFFARKQYLMGAILVAFPIILYWIVPSATSSLGGVGIAIAMMAKSFYLQDAMAKIAKIVAALPPNADREHALAQAGGLSLPAAGISGLFYAAIVAITVMSVWGSR